MTYRHTGRWMPVTAGAVIAALLVLPGQPATAQQHSTGEVTGQVAAQAPAGDAILFPRRARLPDFDLAAQRLLQNQADIGDALEPFYGREAADELTQLLRDHILIAVDVLIAAKAGDQPALDDALARWDANAGDIATFLNAANPDNWPLSEKRAMMSQHLALTTQEAVARLTGDYAGDIAAYDAIHDQILEMADMLSTGVISQFPDRFRPGPG